MEMREPDDPGRGRQPKYEALVMRGEDRFALTVRLPSGETIDVPLGAVLGADVPVCRSWSTLTSGSSGNVER